MNNWDFHQVALNLSENDVCLICNETYIGAKVTLLSKACFRPPSLFQTLLTRLQCSDNNFRTCDVSSFVLHDLVDSIVLLSMAVVT